MLREQRQEKGEGVSVQLHHEEELLRLGLEKDSLRFTGWSPGNFQFSITPQEPGSLSVSEPPGHALHSTSVLTVRFAGGVCVSLARL